jgi:hypothetical protein
MIYEYRYQNRYVWPGGSSVAYTLASMHACSPAPTVTPNPSPSGGGKSGWWSWRTDERTDGRPGRPTDLRADGRTEDRTDGRVGGWTGGRVGGRADQRTDGLDGRPGGRTAGRADGNRPSQEKAVVCTAAYSACGVYNRAQYPVHRLAERTDSVQVRAVRLRMTNQNKS